MEGDQNVGNASANSKRKRSKVWNEMNIYRDRDGKEWAKCSHCEKKFDGSSKKGTTHLKNHLERCRAKPKRKGDHEDKSRDLAASTGLVVIKENSVIDLIRNSFDKNGKTTEHWDPLVLNSRKVEILKAYQGEMVKVGQFLNKLSCRFTLEIYELRFDRYSQLKVHYIDDGWERQSKFISLLEYHSDKNLIEAVKGSCWELKIDRDICSVIKSLYLADHQIEEMNGWFSQRGSLTFGGILNNFGALLGTIYGVLLETYAVDAIRDCVDYVYEKSLANNLKLQSAIYLAKSKGKKVIFHEAPLLITDFKYLEIAVGLKEALCELEKIDPYFGAINLTKENWDEATATFEHMKAFNDVKDSLYSRSKYDAPIVNFPKLSHMHKILSVPCNRSEDCHICRDPSARIKQFVDRFWNKYYLVAVIAIILDPRFKIETVQLWYKEIYGSEEAYEYLEKIIKYFKDVYDGYAAKDSCTESKPYKMLDAMGRPCTSSSSSSKSELEMYLKELRVPAVEDFDILAWWRGNAPFYPTLARMARDYLTLPICRTPAIDSTLMNEIYTMIDSEIDGQILSALACLKGWL